MTDRICPARLLGAALSIIVALAGNPATADEAESPQTGPVDISREIIDFGEVEDVVVSDYTFGITNTGESPVRVLSQAIEGAGNNRFVLISGADAREIEPGGSILLTVRYEPAGTAGHDTAVWIAVFESEFTWRESIQIRGDAIDTVGPMAIGSGDFSLGSITDTSGRTDANGSRESRHFRLADFRMQNQLGSSELQINSTGRADVQVDIVDSRRERVKSLGLHENLSGSRLISWDGRDELGKAFSEGKLVWRLKSKEYVAWIDIIPGATASWR